MKLKQYLKSRKKVSFRYLAGYLGISPSLLNYYLDRHDIPAIYIKKIAEATDDSVDNLMNYLDK